MAVFVDHLGNEYESIAAGARAWGLSPVTVTKRLARGMSVKRALTKKHRITSLPCVDHLGRKYRSVMAMARAWNIPESTLKERLRNHWPIKVALTRAPMTRDEANGIPCADPEGNLYQSIKDMAEAHGLMESTVRFRLRNGATLEQALRPLEYTNRNPARDHLGYRYPSITAMAKAWGLRLETLSRRLNKGWDIRKALTTAIYCRKPEKMKLYILEDLIKALPNKAAMLATIEGGKKDGLTFPIISVAQVGKPIIQMGAADDVPMNSGEFAQRIKTKGRSINAEVQPSYDIVRRFCVIGMVVHVGDDHANDEILLRVKEA